MEPERHVHEGNADQAAYWGGEAGRRWIDRQQTLDVVLAPIQEILLARAAVAPGERVIDIGCGCGASAIALAQRVGRTGKVTGVDISAPMLARARERTPADLPLQLVAADATVHAFEPGAADLLVSRFGVMFFADPTQSFRNMRLGLRPGGRMAFACWRGFAENPWMRVPFEAACRHVAPPPQPGPAEPGPFAFADEARVRRILEEAGFAAIALEPADVDIDLAAGQGLDAAVRGALDMGPARRAVEGQPASVVTKVEGAVRTALAPFQRGDAVPLPAAVWIATAANGGPASATAETL